MRNVSAEVFADEWFGMMPPVYRLLWIGLLVNVADDQGRMLDNPALIRATLFPYDDDIKLKDVEKALALFAAKHKITRYGHGTNGSTRKLIQINNWWRYQKSANWAGRSQYPAPPKWVDRIRAHETGGIALVNWDSCGGYEAAMKRQRSGNKAAMKPLPFVKDDINNDVKEVLVVVVGDALKKYSAEIAKPTDHVREHLIKLYNESPENMVKAMDITIEQGKRTFAYFKGVYRNLKNGTQKPERKPHGNASAQPRKLDAGRQVRL